MSKGAKVPRSFRSVGLQSGQTLAHARVGGGVQDLLRRSLTRSSPNLPSGSGGTSGAPWPSPVVENGSGSPLTATLILTDDGEWSFSWAVALTRGDPGNVITLSGNASQFIGGPVVNLGTVDASGLLVGGGLSAEFGAGDAASFALTTSTPPDTDITLTVRAALIRRGLSGHT